MIENDVGMFTEILNEVEIAERGSEIEMKRQTDFGSSLVGNNSDHRYIVVYLLCPNESNRYYQTRDRKQNRFLD